MKKILITGAAGFLGQLSIDYFKHKYKLYLVDKVYIKSKNFLQIDITNFKEVDKALTINAKGVIFFSFSSIDVCKRISKFFHFSYISLIMVCNMRYLSPRINQIF